jgi:hypothetical protein
MIGRAARLATPFVAATVIAILAAGVMSTRGQFMASITNPENRVRSASVVLTENDVCSAPGDGQWHECGSVDKFGGGNLASGASTTTTVTLRNTGVAPAQLFLLPSQCSDTLTGAHGALCDQVTVEVACAGTTVVTSRTLNGFHDGRNPPTGYAVGTLGAGAGVTCQFTLVAGSVADPGTASQPISWKLTAAQEVSAAMTP